MITALLHTLGSISFPLKWQYPDLAVQGEFFSSSRGKESSAITTWGFHNNLQMPGVLHVYGWKMTRSGDVAWGEKVTGCNVGPGVETKPNAVHARWTEDLAFRPSAVHHQDQEPATDRVWFGQMDGQTCVVCCWEGQAAVWNFTTGFEIITQAVNRLQADSKCRQQIVHLGYRTAKRRTHHEPGKLLLHRCDSAINLKHWKMEKKFNNILE